MTTSEVRVTTSVRPGLALVALALAVVVVGLDTTILNVALPTISSDLVADTSRLQWIVDAYLLAVVAVMLPAGRLGDRFGRRRILLCGLAVFLVGTVASAISVNSAELVVGRAIQGTGAAVIVPLALALVVTLFPPEGRARAIALLTAAVAVGLPLGPIVAGALLQHFSWSSIFWINVPLALSAAVGCMLWVPESRAMRSGGFDVVGIILSAGALVPLIYGVVGAPQSGWSSWRTLSLVAIGLALGSAFVLWQRRAPNALVDLRLFTISQFSWSCAAVMSASGVLLAVLFVVPQYLQGVRHYGELGVGLHTLPLMLGLLVAGSTSTRLQKRLGTRGAMSVSFCMLCFGLVTCAAVSAGTPYALLATGLFVAGAGIGAIIAQAMETATSAVADETVGSASAIINTVRQLGGVLSVAAMGSLLSAIYGHGVASAITQLPAGFQHSAAGSLSLTIAATARAGAVGAEVRTTAVAAFGSAMRWTFLSCAAASAIVGCSRQLSPGKMNQYWPGGARSDQKGV